MKSREDLTGREFGRLTVLNRDDTRIRGEYYWWCKCNCENKTLKSISVYSLLKKGGGTISCGCLRIEAISKHRDKKNNIYDLTGEYGIGY